MAVQTTTVNKFGIPISAGNKTPGLPGSALLQLKYKYRFRVVVINFGVIGNIPTPALDFTQQVQMVSKPSVNFAEIKIDSYNSTAYLAGKHTWEEVTVTLRDDSTNRISGLVGAQLQSQLNMYQQSAAAAGMDYKFDMFIDVLDGTNTGEALESWTLEGCYLSKVTYGDLDYAGSEVQTIQLGVRYDNATIDGGITGVDIMPNGYGDAGNKVYTPQDRINSLT